MDIMFDQLEKKLNLLLAQKRDLDNEKKRLVSEKESLRSRLKQQEEDIQRYKLEVDKLRAEKDEVENRLQFFENRLCNIVDKVEDESQAEINMHFNTTELNVIDEKSINENNNS